MIGVVQKYNGRSSHPDVVVKYTLTTGVAEDDGVRDKREVR